MKRLWPRRFFYEWSQNLHSFWPIYVCGFFLFLAGVLGGIYTANALESAYTDKILYTVMGYAISAKTGVRFLRLSLYRLASLCGIVLFTNSIVMLPIALLGFCISGAMWGAGMGCIFLSVTAIKFILLLVFFIVLLFLHAAPHICVFHKMLLHVRHTIKDRRIPKSSSDLAQEFMANYQSCLGWFLFSALASLLEAFLLPLFLT